MMITTDYLYEDQCFLMSQLFKFPSNFAHTVLMQVMLNMLRSWWLKLRQICLK